jgi:uncharacterized protein YfaS (alpha-2-macroglobulin family)
MFDKKFNIIIAVFMLLFASITYLSISNNRLPFFSRASNKELDITKTVVIISKLEAIANNNDQSLVTVFTRNSDGAAVAGRQVNIALSLGTANQLSSLSDSYGKAEFKVVSDTPGTAELQVMVDNQPLAEKYSINFIAEN